MVMYFQAFQRGLTFLKSFLESVAQMYEDNLFLSNFYEYLDLEPLVKNQKSPEPMPETISRGVEFKDVGFHYPDCDKKVLDRVSFLIRPGEVVALVGENGAGKSTIVKLLSRFYDPDSGSIRLDGEDIRHFDISDYRRKVSVLFQDSIRYHLSVRENIAFGDISRIDDFDRIRSVAARSGIHHKIESFEKSYDTVLGRWFKDGEELSVGQWQMLGISRAFFRDAELIVMDEPSSALDAETEMRIFSKLRELIQNRSVLIISHRYSTVRQADRIIVLDNGTIVEQGTHEELTALNGRYSEWSRAWRYGLLKTE
jgi:ATP-binding cassette subfamily B protein